MTKLPREARGSQRQARAVVSGRKPPEVVLASMPHPAVFVYIGCVETLTEVFQRTEWSHSLPGNVHLWRQKHSFIANAPTTRSNPKLTFLRRT